MHVVQLVAIGFMVLVYAVGSSVELAMWRKSIDQFVRWGYPRYWPIVTQLLKIAGGLMIIFPQTRAVGVVLCLIVALAGFVTLLGNGERSLYAASFSVCALSVAAGAVILLGHAANAAT